MCIKSFLARAGEMAPVGRGELFFDDFLSLLHVGRTFVGVVTVGADEMEQVVDHQLQR